MKDHVKASKTGSVEIKVSAAKEDREALLSSFQKCQTGQCGCPTAEYSKIENMDVAVDESSINIHIEPKLDETIDISEVEKCLAWTRDHVQRK
ncbi:hypothetical protein [Magnetovibrio sp.]|uniref:hypothetical protein n=1 Tax=Magnetovibrio sp. TaxID=2024836 RepID=UPI002F92AF36